MVGFLEKEPKKDVINEIQFFEHDGAPDGDIPDRNLARDIRTDRDPYRWNTHALTCSSLD